MKPNVQLLLVAGLVVTAATGGCASTMQAYPGPARPRDEIAIVSGGSAFYLTSSSNVYLQAVDGVNCTDDDGDEKAAEKVAVLPGRHSVRAVIWESRTSLWISIPTQSTSPAKVVSFIAEAGHKYTVKGYMDEPELWIWVVDEKTKEVVGGEERPD